MFLWFLLFLPLGAALVVAALPAVDDDRHPASRLLQWLPLLPLGLFGGALTYLPRITDGQPLRTSYVWVETLGLELSLVLDGLSLLFVLIITGIGALIVLYTNGYFEAAAERKRFLVYLLFFMTAMLGVVLSGNLLGMFVFWELTSVASYLLIGFKHQKAAARSGARQALIVTGGGGLALLGGIALLGVMSGGVYDLQALHAMRDTLLAHHLLDATLVLILLGAFTKSAQYPFHFWLPGAMEAPTPASSYLHSATMVKAGVYLLARLAQTFGGTDLWLYGLVSVGLFTFVYGGLLALTATDLKAILAYTTVSWLGALVALLGLNTKDSLKAAMVGIIAHALYKGALFLIAGAVDHETGTRDIRRLGGLARRMPYTAGAAFVVLLSMGGIPPMVGFLAKETLKVAALAPDMPAALATVFPIAAVLGSALTVAAALIIGYETFLGQTPAEEDMRHVHEAPAPLWLGPAVLATLSLGLAVFLAGLLKPLLGPAVTAVYGQSTTIDLHLIPALDDPAFHLSLLGIAAGLVIGAASRPLRRRVAEWPLLNPTVVYARLFGTGEHAQDKAAPSLLDAGYRFVDEVLQNGRLRYYVAAVAVGLVTIVLAALAYVQVNGALDMPDFAAELSEVTILETVIAGAAMLAAVQVTLSDSRLAAVVWAGVTGSQLALLFVLFGAPDLAFTALLIEVLSLILIMLAFRLLPQLMQDTSRFDPSRIWRDVIIASSVGLTMSAIMLLVTANRQAPSIRDWFEQNAYTVGLGKNIVNVILVDFRGIDTLGEVTVLIIAALGVLSLINPMPLLDILDRPEEEILKDERQRAFGQEGRDESVLSHIYHQVSLVFNINQRLNEREKHRSSTTRQPPEEE